MSQAATVVPKPDLDVLLPGTAYAFHEYDEARLTALQAEFRTASPFPHLVIDNFLRLPPEAVLPSFPGRSWPNWNKFNDAYQHQKRSCSNITAMPPLFQRLIQDLSGPAFLEVLEKVSGIRGLIPDPYLAGGGLHSSGPGGTLTPHADFHSYGRLALYRKLNVLVYLNPGWTEDRGGSLELFRKGDMEPTVSVVPEYGRMVLFLTDDKSIHGFTRPVSETGAWRNSIALYYYTSEDTSGFKGDGTTYWQMHGKQSGKDRLRLLGYKLLQRGAWTLSKMAHGMNPNLKHKPTPGTHDHD